MILAGRWIFHRFAQANLADWVDIVTEGISLEPVYDLQELNPGLLSNIAWQSFSRGSGTCINLSVQYALRLPSDFCTLINGRQESVKVKQLTGHWKQGTLLMLEGFFETGVVGMGFDNYGFSQFLLFSFWFFVSNISIKALKRFKILYFHSDYFTLLQFQVSRTRF